MNTKKQLRILKSLVKAGPSYAYEDDHDFTEDILKDVQKFFESWDNIWDAAFNYDEEQYKKAGIDVDLITEIGN